MAGGGGVGGVSLTEHSHVVWFFSLTQKQSYTTFVLDREGQGREPLQLHQDNCLLWGLRESGIS